MSDANRIKVLFWFDVEDFINDESEEALLGLLDLLDERDIVGIFKIVGEKARAMARNGRDDLFARLKRHEIGYHTDWHSVHPVVTEYLEQLGFREGAEAFRQREGAGFDDLRRLTGQPIRCYGQPGQAWAPQPFPVLKQWGISAYLDGHDQVTMGGRPFWYGGLLNLASLEGIMSLPLEEDALPRAKAEFDRLCAQQRHHEIGLISIFYHPTEFVFSEFWDAVNFAKGNNPPREAWVKPAARPAGDMRKYLDRVGEFIDYTLTKPNVEYVSTAQLGSLERTANRALTREEVARLAARTGSELCYLTEGRINLSAAELFGVFRRQLLGQELQPELLYGPEREEPSDAVESVEVADMLDALRAPLPEVCGFQQLPDAFIVGGKRIDPVTMTCTMAAIIASGLGAEDAIRPVNGTLTPVKHAGQDGKWAEWWCIFPEGLQVANILRMSKLQTWTIKPALLTDQTE